MKKLLSGVVVALVTASCSKVPSSVIQPEEMAQLMADVHTGEAMAEMNRANYPNDSTKQALKQSIYLRHGVTAQQVDSSFAWYGRNITFYMDVYDRTIEILDRRLIETGNRIAAEAALSIAGDSVDVWPNARFLTFNDLMPSRTATFSFSNDENWERGDCYTWRAKFFNNTETLRFTIVAEYTDGTVDMASKSFSGEGWNELVFSSDSTRTANRIFGFIDGLSRPGTMLRADSMEMIRKRVNHENPVGRYNIHTFHNLADTVELKNAAQTDSVASS